MENTEKLYIMRTIGNGYLLSEEEITEEEYHGIKAFLDKDARNGETEHRTTYDSKEVYIRKDGSDTIKTTFEIGTLPAYYPAW